MTAQELWQQNRDLGDACLKHPARAYALALDGGRSILTGIAANTSIETGGQVRIDSLLDPELLQP